MTEIVKTNQLPKYGFIGTSRRVSNEVPAELIERLLQRHINSDWGDLDEEDKEVNECVMRDEDGGTLNSSYKDAFEGKTILVRTEGYGLKKEDCHFSNLLGRQATFMDYCHTLVLFPEEY
tara:strand:+ start:490 stop:849 length:360 start_codon:yes stop_codon:yes gene_type:complete